MKIRISISKQHLNFITVYQTRQPNMRLFIIFIRFSLKLSKNYDYFYLLFPPICYILLQKHVFIQKYSSKLVFPILYCFSQLLSFFLKTEKIPVERNLQL